jgi:DnaJ family protein C protein 17
MNFFLFMPLSELESKEAQQKQNFVDEAEATRRMQKEIERLREEGKRRIAEHEEMLRKEFLKTSDTHTAQSGTDTLPTLKVIWKSKKSDTTNGGYNKELLEQLFSKYGPLNHVLVSAKKNGKAVISFEEAFDAQRAFEKEEGLASNPLHVTWLEGQPPAQTDFQTCSRVSNPIPPATSTAPSQSPFPLHDSKDYESITLMRMRQAEERKRIAQQLVADDDSS